MSVRETEYNTFIEFLSSPDILPNSNSTEALRKRPLTLTDRFLQNQGWIQRDTALSQKIRLRETYSIKITQDFKYDVDCEASGRSMILAPVLQISVF